MTMIEKMARAIWANRRAYLGSWQGQAHISNQELEHADAGERKRVYQDARSALMALTEPTEIMLLAGYNAACETGIHLRDEGLGIVQAMVRAAFDEESE